MCSHYQAVQARARLARMGIQVPRDWAPPSSGAHIYPTYRAPFLRRPQERSSGDEAVPAVELVEGHFGLLPGFAKNVQYGLNTYNARVESIDRKPSFKGPWSKAQHCIVPCEWIYEPDWRSGENVPTRFERTDGAPLGVAGLWATRKWLDGTVAESFTMLTINADDHPIMKHMHRPDLKRPPELQDKRMVVILPAAQYLEWLDAPVDRGMEFMRQFSAEGLRAIPEPVPKAQLSLF
jgi:putative SOS response-associated peptidase YedK